MNKTIDFLIEKKIGNTYIGTTDNYIKACITDTKTQPLKSIIKIRLTGFKNSLPSGFGIS
ncbi:MAG: hypothetical protein SNJ53_05645 [Thermodesulfovibrionales bacterium]